MNKSLATVLIAAALAVPLPAAAHTEEHFDTITAPHGGQMRMAGPYHLELVTKDKEIVLYVTDHSDNKISTGGGVGKASIQIGKASQKTQSSWSQRATTSSKVPGTSLSPPKPQSWFIKLPEQDAQSARFTPLKSKAKAAKKPQEKKPAAGQYTDMTIITCIINYQQTQVAKDRLETAGQSDDLDGRKSNRTPAFVQAGQTAFSGTASDCSAASLPLLTSMLINIARPITK